MKGPKTNDRRFPLPRQIGHEVTVDAGVVGQQLPQGDLVPARKIRDVLGQFIVDAQSVWKSWCVRILEWA